MWNSVGIPLSVCVCVYGKWKMYIKSVKKKKDHNKNIWYNSRSSIVKIKHFPKQFIQIKKKRKKILVTVIRAAFQVESQDSENRTEQSVCLGSLRPVLVNLPALVHLPLHSRSSIISTGGKPRNEKYWKKPAPYDKGESDSCCRTALGGMKGTTQGTLGPFWLFKQQQHDNIYWNVKNTCSSHNHSFTKLKKKKNPKPNAVIRFLNFVLTFTSASP